MTLNHLLSSQRTFARWRPPAVWALALWAHLLLLRVLPSDSHALRWLNNLVWVASSIAAMLVCANTARYEPSTAARTAWRLLAGGCASWSVGQLLWSYRQLIRDVDLPFPSWPEPFFLMFVPLTIAGLLRLPKPAMASGLTFKHVANLALLTSCLLAILVIALLEPSRASSFPPLYLWFGALRCAAIASVAIVALYLFWSYRWQGSRWPLLLIAMGAAIYAASDIYYAHALISGDYQEYGWINASWVVVFGFIACAAAEQRWQTEHPNARVGAPADARRSLRERCIEAVIPAALIIVAVGVAILNAQWLTPLVLSACAGIAVFFAVALGAREAWIQREEQRLAHALRDSNSQLHQLNHKLSVGETRYRALSEVLEQRVAKRTAELEHAYREMESFSYAVAHDLKAPLRAIDGFGALLAEHYAQRLDEKGRDYVQRMQHAAVNMAHLIDDLLAYARLDRRDWRLDAVDLPELARQVIAEQDTEIAQRGVRIETDIVPIALRADREGLASVLRNLLQNAVKFSRQAMPPQIAIDIYEWNGGVRIAVRDNGIGFDMNFHDQIFEVFQRLHRGDEFPGTGIGLAIVRKAVERLHGRVWADSQPGKGATFFVDLPLDAAADHASRPEHGPAFS